MRSRIVVLGTVAALALCLSSCGSSRTSTADSVTESTLPSTEPSTDASALPTDAVLDITLDTQVPTSTAATEVTTTLPPTSTSAAVDPFCAHAKQFDADMQYLDALGDFSGAAIESAMRKAVAAFDKWAAVAPAGLKPSIEFFAHLASVTEGLLSSSGGDLTQAAQDPEWASLISDTRLETAPRTISSWFRVNCGITIDLTPTIN